VNRFLHLSMPFDPDAAFTPVGLIATVPNIVMVRRESPFRSFADLVAALRARPGELRYGDPGVGSTGHLTTELLMAATGTRAIHASYRGSQPMLNDLVAGSFDFSTDQLTSALGLVQSGAIRVLAVSTPERSPLIPEVPTFRELGIPLEVAVWFSIVAPAGVPAPIVTRLNRALNAVLATPEVRARLAALAAQPAAGTPDDLRRTIAQEVETTRRAVQIANLRPE
jgi:tripartite-type tricarboxylate transporter receptor subunit TctC